MLLRLPAIGPRRTAFQSLQHALPVQDLYLVRYLSQDSNTDSQVERVKWLKNFQSYIESSSTLPKEWISTNFSRSSGPGGQNVNKGVSFLSLMWANCSWSDLLSIASQYQSWSPTRLEYRFKRAKRAAEYVQRDHSLSDRQVAILRRIFTFFTHYQHEDEETIGQFARRFIENAISSRIFAISRHSRWDVWITASKSQVFDCKRQEQDQKDEGEKRFGQVGS